MLSVKTTAAGFLSLCLLSCNSENKSSEEIKQMESSLSNSIKRIDIATQLILHELENRTQDPISMERSSIWFEKAKKVYDLTLAVYNSIDSIKKQTNIKRSSIDLVHTKLSHYKKKLLELDTSVRQEFETIINSLAAVSPDANAKSSLLTKLQNDIKIVENEILVYCISATATHDIIDEFPSAIVAQNSNYLKPGDNLEIRAGVGSFGVQKNQSVTINGALIPIGDEGYSIYKMKVQKLPGIYKIPVEIKFVNRMTGREEFQNFNVEYTVAKPCSDQQY